MINTLKICLWVAALAGIACAADATHDQTAVRFYLPGESSANYDRPGPAGASSLSVVADLPTQISLNGDWDFYYDGISEGKRRGVSYAMKEVVPPLPTEESYEAIMPVPGYWDDHLANLRSTSWWFWAEFNSNYRKMEFPMGSFFVPPFANLPYLVGTGYYRKKFELPKGLIDKKITLSIGGVVEKAEVYLNGSRVGAKGDYLTPGDVDLSGYLREGTNELIIAVTNRDTFARGAPTSCAIDGYQGFTGGIYGNVSLKICDTPRINDLYVYALGDKLEWRVETDGFVDNSLLQWSIQDAIDGHEVLKGEYVPSQAGPVTWENSSAQLQDGPSATPCCTSSRFGQSSAGRCRTSGGKTLACAHFRCVTRTST
jgi:hypothetical protein